jgi:hypothetical protein
MANKLAQTGGLRFTVESQDQALTALQGGVFAAEQRSGAPSAASTTDRYGSRSKVL